MFGRLDSDVSFLPSLFVSFHVNPFISRLAVDGVSPPGVLPPGVSPPGFSPGSSPAISSTIRCFIVLDLISLVAWTEFKIIYD